MARPAGIIKGSLLVTLARIASSVCAFILFWLISQKSVIHAGEFRTIFVFFLFTEFLPLLGMNQFIIKAVSINRSSIKKYLIHSGLFGLIVTIFIGLGLTIIHEFGSYTVNVSSGLLMIIISLPASALAMCLQSILVGLGRSYHFGMIQGFETMFRTMAGLVVFSYTGSVLWVMACFVLFRWFILFIYWSTIHQDMKFEPWEYDSGFLKTFVKKAPQFAGILFLFLIIRFSSQLMVPWMEGDAAAGYFAVSYQFLDMLLLVPTAVAMNLMPVFAKKAEISITSLSKACSQALKLMGLIIVPGIVFISMNAEPLIHLIFGNSYESSIHLLRIVIWAGLILSMDMILSTAMIAAGRQDMDLLSLMLGSVAMVIFLYVFISLKGLIGAGMGLCFGMAVLFTTRVLLFRHCISRIWLPALLWRCCIAGITMAGFMVLWDLGIIFNGVLSFSVYAGILLLSGAVKPNERKSMSELLGA